MDILIVIGIAAGLSLIFALLILLVSKFCAVKEDERVAKVLEHLAGANCGGCGYAGCEGFAKALAEGKAPLSGCGPTSNAEKELPDAFLRRCVFHYIEFPEQEQMEAILLSLIHI